MTSARFILPRVKTSPDTRPSSCNRCGSPIPHKRGTSDNPVRDLYVERVTAQRYRCVEGCGHTFRR